MPQNVINHTFSELGTSNISINQTKAIPVALITSFPRSQMQMKMLKLKFQLDKCRPYGITVYINNVFIIYFARIIIIIESNLVYSWYNNVVEKNTHKYIPN